MFSTRGRPTTEKGPSPHPGTPGALRMLRRQDVPALTRAVSAGRRWCCATSAQHALRLRCATGRAGPTSLRADPSLQTQFLSAGAQGTGAAQRRLDFNVLGFATLHEDGRDIVRVHCRVKTCSKIHAITWSGNGRARHGGPGLDLELHVGVLGRPGAVRCVAGLDV